MIRVCITGPDGTGKSTLAAAVAAALDARHGVGTAVVAQIWDSLQPLVTREAAQRYLALVDDRSRALLLLHAVSRSLALAEATGASVVVLDGYWYKYAVSELEHGTPPAVFAGCDAAFPHPELTVALDLAVDEALRRKVELTAYERGFSDDDAARAFVAFQQRLRTRWDALEADVGPWLHLSALDGPETLCERVVREVEARMEGG
ncbi:MAG: hypothetical protein H6737_05605 [Alphaproteobacteria bacterium]|nr:hypothetical protein [Alphaproteobacteria bacterium]